MVTLNYANIIVFKYLNAGVRISLPVNYIASAYNAINPRSVQVVDSCFEPFVFGVNVTDNPNSPVSHAQNLFSGLGCIIVIPSEIIEDECGAICTYGPVSGQIMRVLARVGKRRFEKNMLVD